MSFFKRILKSADEPRPVARTERRGGRRHLINPEFPLLAMLSLAGRDVNRNPATSGDFCDLKPNLEGFALVVPCHITNMRVERDGVFFGLKHDITDEVTRNGYRELLEIVALGATLKLKSKTTKPDESGYLMELYASDLPSRLRVWRHEAGQTVAAFEFLLKDSLMRAAKGRGWNTCPAPRRAGQADNAHAGDGDPAAIPLGRAQPRPRRAGWRARVPATLRGLNRGASLRAQRLRRGNARRPPRGQPAGRHADADQQHRDADENQRIVGRDADQKADALEQACGGESSAQSEHQSDNQLCETA